MADRRLRIAVVAHVRHPIAQPFMGGMEAHCDLLVRELVAAGHDVTLFASGDSAADLPLHPIAPRAYEAELPWALWHGSDRLAEWLEAAYSTAWAAIRDDGFDVVHNNALFPALHDWAMRDGIAMVTSLHIPPFAALSAAVARNTAPWLRLTVTSSSQLPSWEALAAGRIAVAHNGIDLSRWRYRAHGTGRAIWFGRITPNKGTLHAVHAAREAGMPLDIVGPVECGDYFAQVRSAMGEGQRYLGHLSGAALVARVAAASVMICTPMWDEPFGLVAAEALACGVPVAALDRGALAEVIGPCGALAGDAGGLAIAIAEATGVSRPACRARAEAMFGARAMVARYADSYAAAVAGRDAACASSMSRTRALLA